MKALKWLLFVFLWVILIGWPVVLFSNVLKGHYTEWWVWLCTWVYFMYILYPFRLAVHSEYFLSLFDADERI